MSKRQYDITVTFRKKKIFVTTDKKRWVWVFLFNYKHDMQKAYWKYCLEMRGEKNNDPVKGASIHEQVFNVLPNGKMEDTGRTGMVLQSSEAGSQ